MDDWRQLGTYRVNVEHVDSQVVRGEVHLFKDLIQS